MLMKRRSLHIAKLAGKDQRRSIEHVETIYNGLAMLLVKN